eukprot:48052-Eustigmatos_ZCMA.PRE.1
METLELPCTEGGAAYSSRFFEDADELFSECLKLATLAKRDKQRIRAGFGEPETYLIGSTRADAQPWEGT